MRTGLAIQLLLPLVIFGLGGCDADKPAVHLAEQPVAAAISDSTHEAAVSENTLHVALLPEAPTAKTAIYARVSGALEPTRFSWLRNGELLEDQNGAALGIDYFSKGDVIEVEAVSGKSTASATVEIGNSPPVVSAVKFNHGSVLTIEPKGSDPDDDAIDFRYQWWVNDVDIISEGSNVLPGHYFAMGDRVSVAVTPFDADIEGKSVRIDDILVENKPPKITSIPPVGFEDGVFDYTVTAEDPEGENLTFLLETAPQGMTIDEQSGKISWTVDSNVTGSHQVNIKVEDTSGRWTLQKFILKMTE